MGYVEYEKVVEAIMDLFADCSWEETGILNVLRQKVDELPRLMID